MKGFGVTGFQHREAMTKAMAAAPPKPHHRA
jgi:hypothetical protein